MADSGPTSAEMGLTPKDMGIQLPEIQRQVDAQTFNQMKMRVEKSRRIREDVRPASGEPYNRARIDEIRDLEQRVNLREPEAGNIDEDMQLDGRGFQEQSYWVSYKSADGQVLKERVVMYAKPGENGQWEFMKDRHGNIMAINGDLYDSRLTSNIHAQGINFDTFTIPRVDGRGAYTGIITLRVDKNQTNKADQAKGTVRPIQPEKSPPASEEDPLDPVRPILDKLKTPGSTSAEPMRLGKEVVLDAKEIAALQALIDKVGAQIGANPGFANLQKLIQEQVQNTAFGISRFFGNAVIEDNQVTSPQVIIEQSGPKIHVSPELFRIWNASVNLNSARQVLDEYRTQGFKGKPAAYLANFIEQSII